MFIVVCLCVCACVCVVIIRFCIFDTLVIVQLLGVIVGREVCY